MEEYKVKLSIDVVVPVTRISKSLYEILNMERPKDVSIRFLFVVDKVGLKLPDDIEKRDDVVVIYNSRNLGAGLSRNVGIEKSSADYILFLDDDIFPERNLLIEYYRAILEDPDRPGYVGYVGFPFDLKNRFHLGVKLSLLTTFFGIAKMFKEVVWGVTANLLINRKKLNDIRFKPVFPKGGGGEDIDFCIRLTRKENKLLKTVPEAKATHPVWSGKGRWKRFFRWRYGDTNLILFYPELTYRSYPILPEYIFILSILMLFLGLLFGPHWFISYLLLMPTLIIVEIFTTKKMIESTGLREYPLIGYIYATFMRLINEFGHLAFIIRHMKFSLLFKRFDYSCMGKFIAFEKKWAKIKFFSYLATTIILLVSIYFIVGLPPF